MLQDQLYLDEVILNMYPVSGEIPGDNLPKLICDLDLDGLFYFNANDSEKIYVKQHEVFLYHNEKYMALDGEWCHIA